MSIHIFFFCISYAALREALCLTMRRAPLSSPSFQMKTQKSSRKIGDDDYISDESVSRSGGDFLLSIILINSQSPGNNGKRSKV